MNTTDSSLRPTTRTTTSSSAGLPCPPTPRICGPRLSAREKEVLLWTSEGKTADEVADTLCVSVYTVNRHASNAARKLGCHNKYHAVVCACAPA